MSQDASNRQEILSELAKAEERLAGLHGQQEELEATIKSLRERLGHANGENAHRTTRASTGRS
tara:strand:+ start:507 stop:695 length:189 start_codon:yes stop_codon:yes gene_type:complete